MKKFFSAFLVGLFLWMTLAGSAIANEVGFEVQQGILYSVEDFVPLERGDKNEEVIKLQTRLIALGYLNDTADGNFGKKTETAVTDFQIANDLEATGVASPEDQVILYSAGAIGADGSAAAAGVEDAQASNAAITKYATETARAEKADVDYILNLNTHKFHYPYCSSVKQMKDSNKKEFSGSRDELIDVGYVPCKRCNP